MAKLLQHILVNISEDWALGQLSALSDIQWTPSLGQDLTTDLRRSSIAAEWRVAEERHAELTRTEDGAPTRGGVNPGDQRAIFTLIRSLKPKRVLEIGTHLGYSTLHICQALKLNAEGGDLTTVDILDVNHTQTAPWRRAKALRSPHQSIAAFGYADHVTFVQSDSIDFLRKTEQNFDFVFLDGDHAAPKVYEELQLLQRVMEPGATLLLHDYFPGGRALWKGSLPNTGPWKAVQRLRREGAPIDVRPLGALPWATKLGTNITSLALVTRR